MSIVVLHVCRQPAGLRRRRWRAARPAIGGGPRNGSSVPDQDGQRPRPAANPLRVMAAIQEHKTAPYRPTHVPGRGAPVGRDVRAHLRSLPFSTTCATRRFPPHSDCESRASVSNHHIGASEISSMQGRLCEPHGCPLCWGKGSRVRAPRACAPVRGAARAVYRSMPLLLGVQSRVAAGSVPDARSRARRNGVNCPSFESIPYCRRKVKFG